MEKHEVPPKREWPKRYWGPDGKPAEFWAPGDIPRDYFPTAEEAASYAALIESKPVVPAPATSPQTGNDEMAEFQRWKAAQAARRENMAKARAARKPKV